MCDTFSSHAQGFAKQLDFTSELLEGSIRIDGLKSFDISLGNTFKVTSNPEAILKGIRFKY